MPHIHKLSISQRLHQHDMNTSEMPVLVIDVTKEEPTTRQLPVRESTPVANQQHVDKHDENNPGINITPCGVGTFDGGVGRDTQHLETRCCGSERRYCKICCRDVSEKNFLMQMKHVKECEERYGGEGCMHQDVGIQQSRMVLTAEEALHVWLTYYGYIEYFDTLVKQKIFLHELCEMNEGEDMEGRTGILQLGSKKRLMGALEWYKRKGRLPLQKQMKKINRGLSKGGGGRQRVGSLKDMLVESKSWRSETEAERRHHDGLPIAQARLMGVRQYKHAARQHSHGDQVDWVDGIRNLELILLRRCFPSICSPNRTKIEGVRESAVLRDQRVSLEKSLWTATAQCVQVAESMEERLEKTEQGVSKRTCMHQDVRSRVVSESLALKRVKLKALEEELIVQERTMQELKSMIEQMREDITQSERQCS